MREIIFRGKRIDNDEWVYGSFCMDALEQKNGLCGIDGFIRLYDFNMGKSQTHQVDRETVGQYTGLTDKNGKKIFEGDILSTEYGTFRNTGMGHILFYKGMWTSFYGQDAIGRDCFDELYTVCTSREVIGNIHDNPELLGGGEGG